MVYTERAPRRQQFHVAPAKQQSNSTVNTLLPVAIQNIRRVTAHFNTVKLSQPCPNLAAQQHGDKARDNVVNGET